MTRPLWSTRHRAWFTVAIVGDVPRTVCKRSGLDGWRYVGGAWSQRKAKMEAGR